MCEERTVSFKTRINTALRNRQGVQMQVDQAQINQYYRAEKHVSTPFACQPVVLTSLNPGISRGNSCGAVLRPRQCFELVHPEGHFNAPQSCSAGRS
jgi:hypothetical protein